MLHINDLPHEVLHAIFQHLFIENFNDDADSPWLIEDHNLNHVVQVCSFWKTFVTNSSFSNDKASWYRQRSDEHGCAGYYSSWIRMRVKDSP